jgi:predicted lipid-binding transport protein (Tim44 family)
MSDIPADIVIYALVAAGLIFWLRTILGTRHGDEPQRPNPFITPDEKGKTELLTAPDKGVELIGAEVPEAAYDPFSDEKIAASLDVRETLREIGQKDRSFEPVSFLKNAEEAFIMIVEAFAEGDRDFLKPLVAETVYDSFVKEIDRRLEKGERVLTEVHAIRKAEIIGAKIEGKMAFISVAIQAQETCVVRDANETIIAGNPNRATEMNDVWVFGRMLKSKDPVWRLYETHDGASPEDHKTPVPEVLA